MLFLDPSNYLLMKSYGETANRFWNPKATCFAHDFVLDGHRLGWQQGDLVFIAKILHDCL
jgi:hypothetical protein